MTCSLDGARAGATRRPAQCALVFLGHGHEEPAQLAHARDVGQADLGAAQHVAGSDALAPASAWLRSMEVPPVA